jgi:hypothetical protein
MNNTIWRTKMKAMSHVLIFSIIFLYACSSTYRLRDGDVTLDEFRGKIRKEKVTIISITGKEYSGYNLQVIDQQFYWDDSKSGNTRNIPVNKVSKIINKHHGQGALDGLGYGFLSGFTFGAIMGILATDPDHKSGGMVDFTPTNYSEGALGYGLALAIPTALIGLPIGAIVGHKDIYSIKAQTDRRHEPKYVKIKVESIFDKEKGFLLVKKQGFKIKLERFHIKHIDQSGDKIYITIPVEVYEQKFKF